MIDLQAVDQHRVLAAHHVVVVVPGKVRMQAIGGLGRGAVTDIVGQDKKILRDVERLSGSEELIGKQGVEQRFCRTAGAVQQQDGIVGMALAVGVRFAEGKVMQAQLRKRLAGAESEIGDAEDAVVGRPRWRRLCAGRGCATAERDRQKGQEGRTTHHTEPYAGRY